MGLVRIVVTLLRGPPQPSSRTGTASALPDSTWIALTSVADSDLAWSSLVYLSGCEVVEVFAGWGVDFGGGGYLLAVDLEVASRIVK